MVVRLYLLRFANRAHLERAFGRVLEVDDVASCAVEPEEARLRFLATPACASDLLERLYLDGGLTWCSVHDLTPGSPRGIRTA